MEAPILRAPSKWAVVIGVDEYSNPKDNTYGGPGNSAKDMYNVLVNIMSFPVSHVHFLVDKIGISEDNVTRARLESELKWLQAVAIPEDMVVFYYAGHGYQSTGSGHEYINTHEDQIRDDEFATEINKVKSTSLVVILDTSFSGGFITDGQTLQQGISGAIPSWTDLATGTPRGRIVLTACAENPGPWTPDWSWLPDRIRHKPLRDAHEQLYWHPETIEIKWECEFTHYLAAGFKGQADSNHDGKVTVEEAFNLALKKCINEFLTRQTPLMYDGYPTYGSSEELYLGQ